MSQRYPIKPVNGEEPLLSSSSTPAGTACCRSKLSPNSFQGNNDPTFLLLEHSNSNNKKENKVGNDHSIFIIYF